MDKIRVNVNNISNRVIGFVESYKRELLISVALVVWLHTYIGLEAVSQSLHTNLMEIACKIQLAIVYMVQWFKVNGEGLFRYLTTIIATVTGCGSILAIVFTQEEPSRAWFYRSLSLILLAVICAMIAVCVGGRFGIVTHPGMY